MPDQDKSPFFTTPGPDVAALRDVSTEVNGKHEPGEVKRGRGRPRKTPIPNTVQDQAIPVEQATSYIDPETVRIGAKAIVRAIDDYVCKKFYHIVIAATGGDEQLAKAFKDEATVNAELVDGYGEAAVGLCKKYAFLLEYAPEGLLLSCILADSGIKYNTYKKIKELCAFVSKQHANSPQAN